MTDGTIGIAGAGAFGTALAIALAREGRLVTLWARNPEQVRAMNIQRQNAVHVPNVAFPPSLAVTANAADLAGSAVILLAMPMQSLAAFLAENAEAIGEQPLIACCKGIDLLQLTGPSAIVGAAFAHAPAGVLTGPSFAADIAAGLPTALTLAAPSAHVGALQELLSTKTLRLYRSTDVIGAELGGALKNVIAIAAGIVIGAGLGDSARAALITRGFVEMQRFTLAMGGRVETVAGLSGFGDLVLTCGSTGSRNFRFGHALGQGVSGKGIPFDPTITVEGVATAKAVSKLAKIKGIDMPITQMIAALLDDNITLTQAISALMSRPLKEE